VRHAFIDYAAATARHQLHLDHQAVTDRILQLAQARQSVTGTLLDIARAETEAARALAAVATDQTTIDAARTRLNSLLARPPHAPLGPPVALPDETATADAADLITRARDQRPEHRAAAPAATPPRWSCRPPAARPTCPPPTSASPSSPPPR
jgi:outer membrane protein TolC